MKSCRLSFTQSTAESTHTSPWQFSTRYALRSVWSWVCWALLRPTHLGHRLKKQWGRGKLKEIKEFASGCTREGGEGVWSNFPKCIVQLLWCTNKVIKVVVGEVVLVVVIVWYCSLKNSPFLLRTYTDRWLCSHSNTAGHWLIVKNKMFVL